METNKETQTIYTEELCIIITPLKARVFSDEYEKHEFYNEDGVEVILLREKKDNN